MRALQISVLLLMAIMLSCEKGSLVDCEKCTISEPDFAQLIISLTKIDKPVEVRIYEGNLEDNILFQSLTTVFHEINATVPFNKKYTVTVLYPMPDGEYIAVDSVLPRIRYEEDQCDDPCYYPYDVKVNLKLKSYNLFRLKDI